VSTDANEFDAKLRRLEGLVQQAERLPDPAARAHVRDIARALLELHATGLERLLDHVAGAGEAGGAILDACAADDVVSGLLLLHGLHPLAVEDRVRQAIERVRGVELLAVDDGVVRLRLGGNCGCASSAAAMRQAVEEAIFAHAPDVIAVEIEGLEAPPAASGRVALPLV
jgi:Fe-S cluster biogenesis protein NfuA